MPDATYVGAGMPCGNCGNPLTPGQPHKCGRTPDFDRRLDDRPQTDADCQDGCTAHRTCVERGVSPDERLREAQAIIAKIPREQLGRIMQELAAADREKPDEPCRICCRGMGADGGCNICAAEATR